MGENGMTEPTTEAGRWLLDWIPELVRGTYHPDDLLLTRNRILAIEAEARATVHLRRVQARAPRMGDRRIAPSKEGRSMRSITIRIGDKDDHTPLFPEHADSVQGEFIAVAILEEGMESGQPSLWLWGEAPDGSTFGFQVSYGQFDGIAAALRGAMGRWTEAERHG